MFTAVLFTRVKMWKQLKGWLTDEQIKKIWDTHIIEYHSALKKKIAIPNKVGGLGGYYTKWNKPDQERNTVWYRLHMESKKSKTNEYSKEETDSQI